MKNWCRECKIIIANEEGKGIDLSMFKCVFKTYQADIRHPTEATITIYNLNLDTQNKILDKEFYHIQIIAGYRGRSGIIFTGQIMYTSTGKIDTDSYITIQAIDSYIANTYTVVNQTLASGYTAKEMFDLIFKNSEKKGVKQGIIELGIDNIRMPRGRPEFGMYRDIMDNLAKKTNTVWYYDNHKINILPKDNHDKFMPEILLTPETGLIGIPKRTINGGVNVRCLINPLIKRYALIKLISSFNAEQQNLKIEGIKDQLSAIDINGQYRIINISYIGDTIGQDWYMDLICLSLNDNNFISKDLLLKGA